MRENSGLRVSDDESACARDTEGPFSYCRSGCAGASTGHPGRVRQGQTYHPTPSLSGIFRNASPLSVHRKARCQQGLWVSVNKLWITRRILCTGWGQPCGQIIRSSENSALTCGYAIPGLWTQTSFETSVIHRTTVDKTAAGTFRGAGGHICPHRDPAGCTSPGRSAPTAGIYPGVHLRGRAESTGWSRSRVWIRGPGREACRPVDGRYGPVKQQGAPAVTRRLPAESEDAWPAPGVQPRTSWRRRPDR
ncbi:hypothetical protein IWX63_001832 [Arthrobacter sp. CAN_A2]